MIRLFHGSYIAVPTPLVKLGRKKVDFGQGFYLTKLRRTELHRGPLLLLNEKVAMLSPS
ncbi:MAG: DUF3990 domain-containing protein [Phocaeicola sp.]